MRIALRIGMVGVAFCFVASAAGAGSFETELKFARGLRDLGYYELAVERFRALSQARQMNPGRQRKIAEGLIDACLSAAKAAGGPVEAFRYMRLASQELARVPKESLNRVEQCVLRMKEGEALMELGRLAREVYARQPKGIKLDDVASEGDAAFSNAADAYGRAAAGFKVIVAAVERKQEVDDADRILRRESLTRQFVAETQVGWAHFRRGKFLLERKRKADAGREFNEAVSVFRRLREAHREITAGLSAALGEGLCEQELGRHGAAIKALEAVLECYRTESTIPVRFRAFYEMAASQAALGKFRDALDSLDEARREYEELPRALEEAWLFRHAKTLGMAADAIGHDATAKLSRARALRGKGDKASLGRAGTLEEDARSLQARARDLYARAAKEARRLVDSGGPYADEATVLLGKWVAAAGIAKRFRTAVDYFAEGERLLASGKHGEAISAYREAIRHSRGFLPAEKKRRVDAWIQMGNAFVAMGRHYEAGLVLGHVARVYPDSRYAEKAAVYSAMLLGDQYRTGRSRFEAETYLDAQELLVERFPRTDAAKRAAFRLGDVRRAEGDYEAAARYYAKVDRASEYYERASYLSGACLWEAFLKRAKAGVEGASSASPAGLAERAERRLTAFLKWAGEQPSGNSRADRERPKWQARARTLLAEMAIRQDDFQRALDLLDGRTMIELNKLQEERADFLVRARLQRLRAFCAVGGIANVERAGAEVEALRKLGGVGKGTLSTAGRLVGMTFLMTADKRMAGGKEGAARSDPVTEGLLKNARKYLILSVELNPEQTIEQYSEVASALARSGAYVQAAETFQRLVERFGRDPARKEVVRDARRWVGICYKRAGEWRKAAAAFGALKKDFPKWMDVRRELALCYESDALRRYSDAEKLWRTVEENFEMGGAEWFEARYHRIRMLLLAGRRELAFQMLGATAISYPGLGGERWEKRFLKLVEEQLDKEERESFLRLRREALAAGG